jgi:phosphoribosylformylglycinamidine synthase
MTWLARIHVLLKPVVNDPQGQAIHQGLRSLGFSEVTAVRAGKFFEVSLDAASAEDAAQRADEMARKLLANPVIEDYRFQVEEQASTRDQV